MEDGDKPSDLCPTHPFHCILLHSVFFLSYLFFSLVSERSPLCITVGWGVG